MIHAAWQWLVHGEGYQILSGPVILVGLVTYYAHHRCQRCLWIGRYKVGPHHVPACHRHRDPLHRLETLRHG